MCNDIDKNPEVRKDNSKAISRKGLDIKVLCELLTYDPKINIETINRRALGQSKKQNVLQLKKYYLNEWKILYVSYQSHWNKKFIFMW